MRLHQCTYSFIAKPLFLEPFSRLLAFSNPPFVPPNLPVTLAPCFLDTLEAIVCVDSPRILIPVFQWRFRFHQQLKNSVKNPIAAMNLPLPPSSSATPLAVPSGCRLPGMLLALMRASLVAISAFFGHSASAGSGNLMEPLQKLKADHPPLLPSLLPRCATRELLPTASCVKIAANRRLRSCWNCRRRRRRRLLTLYVVVLKIETTKPLERQCTTQDTRQHAKNERGKEQRWTFREKHVRWSPRCSSLFPKSRSYFHERAALHDDENYGNNV